MARTPVLASKACSAVSGMLRRLTRPAPLTAEANQLHDAIVSQARLPAFYSDLGVPDTIDGRFDLLVLHAFLVFRALERHGREGRLLGQKACDTMFRALDEAVRELGVGDMGVPRRLKSMSSAYQGRSQAYARAVESSRVTLKEALQRNLYRGASVDPLRLESLAGYVLEATKLLDNLPFERFLAGDLDFGAPQKLGERP